MSDVKKDIVKYDNKFNLTNINKLDKIEMDILFSVCSEITKTKKLYLEIPFEYLSEKAYLVERDYRSAESAQKMDRLGNKVIDLKFTVKTQNSIEIVPLFTRFKALLNEEKMIIEMNPHFANYFFDIPEKIGFSRFELEKFVFLRSKYSKTLFRHLLEHHRGEWKIKAKDLRELIGIPESYSTGMLMKTLNKIIPELEESGYFQDIKITPTYSKKQGRPMSDIIFEYTINPLKKAEKDGQTTILDYDYATKTVERSEIEFTTRADGTPVAIETVKTIEEDERCPKCGAKIIVKTNKNGEKYRCCENSGYWRLGNADCNFYEK